MHSLIVTVYDDPMAHVNIPAANTQRCPRCGGNNGCAVAQGLERCWCMAEPAHSERPHGAITPTANATSCFCRECLRELAFLADAEKPAQLQNPNIPR